MEQTRRGKQLGPFPNQLLHLMQSAPIRAASTAAIWSHHESPSAPANAIAAAGKCCLRRKRLPAATFSAGPQLSPIHHSQMLPRLDISRLQLISSSRSAPHFRLFTCLCPASANPNRNVTQVIWLPINRADRGKTGSIPARKEAEKSHH